MKVLKKIYTKRILSIYTYNSISAYIFKNVIHFQITIFIIDRVSQSFF